MKILKKHLYFTALAAIAAITILPGALYAMKVLNRRNDLLMVIIPLNIKRLAELKKLNTKKLFNGSTKAKNVTWINLQDNLDKMSDDQLYAFNENLKEEILLINAMSMNMNRAAVALESHSQKLSLLCLPPEIRNSIITSMVRDDFHSIFTNAEIDTIIADIIKTPLNISFLRYESHKSILKKLPFRCYKSLLGMPKEKLELLKLVVELWPASIAANSFDIIAKATEEQCITMKDIVTILVNQKNNNLITDASYDLIGVYFLKKTENDLLHLKNAFCSIKVEINDLLIIQLCKVNTDILSFFCALAEKKMLNQFTTEKSIELLTVINREIFSDLITKHIENPRITEMLHNLGADHCNIHLIFIIITLAEATFDEIMKIIRAEKEIVIQLAEIIGKITMKKPIQYFDDGYNLNNQKNREITINAIQLIPPTFMALHKNIPCTIEVTPRNKPSFLSTALFNRYGLAYIFGSIASVFTLSKYYGLVRNTVAATGISLFGGCAFTYASAYVVEILLKKQTSIVQTTLGELEKNLAKLQ